ncbi:hypothetical protein EAF00_001170 [Botryotinia globosa]|nr:hypothetical protein EAF00_001170 [Botryotinia globosa]
MAITQAFYYLPAEMEWPRQENHGNEFFPERGEGGGNNMTFEISWELSAPNPWILGFLLTMQEPSVCWSF